MTRREIESLISGLLGGIPCLATCPGPAHVLVTAQGCTDPEALRAAHAAALERIPMWVYLEVVGKE
jgi:hypothetical protein